MGGVGGMRRDEEEEEEGYLINNLRIVGSVR